MRWPDLFFRARKSRPDPKPSSSVPSAPEKIAASSDPHPPQIQPLPAELGPQAVPAAPTDPVGRGTRTLPAMHGVILRPPVGPVPPEPAALETPAPEAPTRPTSSFRRLKNIEQLMAEADPVRTLRESGNVRMLKRLAPEPGPAKAPAETPAEPTPGSTGGLAAAPLPQPAAPVSPPLQPSVQPVSAPAAVAVKEAAGVPPPSAPAPLMQAPAPLDPESPFILKPATFSASTSKIVLPPASALTPPLGSIFRRKAKMTELARLVPPSKGDPEPPTPPTEPSPTVVPAAFPIADGARDRDYRNIPTDTFPTDSSPTNSKAEGSPSTLDPEVAQPNTKETPFPAAKPAPTDEEKPPAPSLDAPGSTKVESDASKPVLTDPAISSPPPAPPVEQKTAVSDSPKIDPEAHKPEPSDALQPKVDPEAHKPDVAPATPLPLAQMGPSAGATPEKREFHLSNGERVAGVVLSETPEAVYLEHSTLGVLTIPRANIAKRLVEIILINGDRIVGDIMAETADTLYVRHASLGMLTVPRAQRSTRVVEAILKDGDRILGEVLTETETFTVIRSATLGTITVPHNKVSMLNRKVEQIELKALPPSAPELKDKPLS
jgi:RNase P/RNase MRP subunit p29